MSSATCSGHASCPKCEKYTMIRESEKVWKCLNCDFKKDFSPPKPKDPPPLFALFLLAAGVVVFLNFLHETRDHRLPCGCRSPQSITPLSLSLLNNIPPQQQGGLSPLPP
ncbi:hypothetical protein PN441_15695 [Spirulina major CS-329]|uniref:hypothetical protein n=1 Tax=Spirulina TaxID=1154 RepID=UPI00232FB641|nr:MULTISPECIES: hypothetical protein [Spirulina]MDB9496832.1 hypothetical protein [Spirulina subsalsa CS-330]MDB9504520.1 hypothetical protein [Spirulina major CS-329]